MNWLYYNLWYHPLMRLAHRFNWHHTRTIGPIEGSVLIRCDWCGLGEWRRTHTETIADCQETPPFDAKAYVRRFPV